MTRLGRLGALVPAGVFVVCFTALAILFPDAPLRREHGAIVGKYGAEHTLQEYRMYRAVSAVSVAMFLFSFAGCIWHMGREESQVQRDP